MALVDHSYRALPLRGINSATKYPSILTYHAMDRGRLQEEVQVTLSGSVLVTEKIDGTNARIILFPGGDYFIGTREEVIYAKGDFIKNPELGIVEATIEVADRASKLDQEHMMFPGVTVFFGEVYGGKVGGASKQYTSHRALGFRLFDVVRFASYDREDLPVFTEIVEMVPSDISLWRKKGSQFFLDEEGIQTSAELLKVPVTPRLGEASLPTSIKDVFEWLDDQFPEGTFAALDVEAKGRPEGVVVRTPDRSSIAKIRFDDYRKALRGRG